MEPRGLAAHETMEIHEMLNFKEICAMKSKLMQGAVQDKELRSLMEKDVQQSVKAIEALQGLLVRTPTQ